MAGPLACKLSGNLTPADFGYSSPLACENRFAGVPTWVFHGAKDRAVPLRESEQMVAAMRAAGGNPDFTVYPDAAHDSWTEAYANPDLYRWLLKQKKQ